MADRNSTLNSLPNLNGLVIGQLTNEVVAINSQVKSFYDANPLIGWTSVVLPNGKEAM